MSDEIDLKIFLLGDSDVDKTKFLNKYFGNRYNFNHLPTIGINYRHKVININDMKIHLRTWDTAAQEKYQNIWKSCLRGADGVFLIYDITNRANFENLKNKYIKAVEGPPEDIKYIIVGNKMDLENERDVSREEVKEFCDKKIHKRNWSEFWIKY